MNQNEPICGRATLVEMAEDIRVLRKQNADLAAENRGLRVRVEAAVMERDALRAEKACLLKGLEKAQDEARLLREAVDGIANGLEQIR